MSTRLTVNRGLDAVATTVIRYRCSASVTSAFIQGSPVGTKTTSSRSKVCCTSLAATRWPLCTGSKVPPITPIRGRRAAPSLTGVSLVGRAARSVADVTVVVRVLVDGLVAVAVGDVAVAVGHEGEHEEDRSGDRGEHPRRRDEGREFFVGLSEERAQHATESSRIRGLSPSPGPRRARSTWCS